MVLSDAKHILLVPSKSRYELEIARFGSESAARLMFSSDSVWNDIKQSHHTQKANLERISSKLGSNKMVYRAFLDEKIISDHDIFVFLGGDDHFTFCSQNILKYLQKHPDEKKFVIGVVLDSNKSVGNLLHFSVDSFLESVDKIREGSFSFEQWTVLEAVVTKGNERVFAYPALGTYFIGELGRIFMSRNRVFLDGEEVFPDKSSGLLVATGTGSCKGSWYDNIHSIMFGESDFISKEEEIAGVILTENKSRSRLTLKKGQTLVVDSYNDDNGIIAPDAHQDHSENFRIGARAEVFVSRIKLLVVNGVR